jgi:hypothetical protein
MTTADTLNCSKLSSIRASYGKRTEKMQGKIHSKLAVNLRLTVRMHEC